MNPLLVAHPNSFAATKSAHTSLAGSTNRPLDSPSQAVLLAKLAREHQVSEQLEQRALSRGALCKVVLALSLTSIFLASAVVVAILDSVLPGILIHVVR